jgi:hypothetical protein
MKKTLFLFYLALLSASITAEGKRVDRFQLGSKLKPVVERIGFMEGARASAIIDSFKAHQLDEVEMVYAIYCWIGLNIGFDCKAFRHPKSSNTSVSHALMSGRTVSQGYAGLFQAMCDIARIKCVTISGMARKDPYSIGKLTDKNRHYWNAVFIDNTWFYIDPAWSAGSTSENFKSFKQEYSDAWFFTNPELFLFTHLPDERQWQFTDDPFTKFMFTNAPVVNAGAIIFDVHPADGMKGKIKGRVKDCKRMVFETKDPSNIKSVAILDGGDAFPVDYYIQGSKLSVDIPLRDDGKYPIEILINGRTAISYTAEVIKRKRG